MPVRRFLLAATLQLLVAAPLAAQQTDSLPSDARRIDGVRVVAPATPKASYSAARSRSATRTDTPLRDIPQSATVLTRALIADQAMLNMGDVVRYVPGITMGLGEGHRDQPTIRGNSTTADFFVDGIRDDAQYLRDTYNVERVEAIMGANALAFGRGGGGGVLNRVSKQAGFAPAGAITVEGGSFGHARETIDLNAPLGARVAARLNGMLQRSGSFRDRTSIRREAVNPTATLLAGASTIVRLDYERFHDERTVDRGIPSQLGTPFAIDQATFFGDPDASRAHARVDAAGITYERQLGPVQLRNATRGVHYDKFYQNVYAGSAVSRVNGRLDLSAYNNATRRANLFNQTDLTASAVTGALTHTLLLGGELSRQGTDNFRQTGYFNGGTSTSLAVAADAPTQATDVTFRQSARDADNHVRLDVGAGYMQDQIALGRRWQAIAGLRIDRFDLRFHNNRTGDDLARVDRLMSPRGGLIFKPAEQASLYASYSVSHLPGSGDQFSSLTATTQTLEPERFTNRELGAKWDVTPVLSLTAALFQLDRTNSTAHDPANPAVLVQTGAQRTTGYELGVSGDVTTAWQIAGGFASQRALLSSATTAGPAGATAPLVPHHTASLWNRVQLASPVGIGLGLVHQSRMYAAIDNSVTVPAFTRVDGALFLGLTRSAKLQLNVENLFDASYYATAQGNNNIMPGAPRTIRLSVTAGR
ncbi:MAG: TonB-dependent siderophore receptor [Gemmatimonadota bacterium]|nr:TonB-dependent siderophore receptor [Gemmatimonadota bacterium]